MLRWWIGLLLVLNAVLLAWHAGALAPWAGPPNAAPEGPSATLTVAPANVPASSPVASSPVLAASAAVPPVLAAPLPAASTAQRAKPSASIPSDSN